MTRMYLDQNVYDAAVERINRLFDDFPVIISAISGGKDSTVVYNLCLRIAEERGRLPLKVFFLDQEAEWQSTIDYVRTVMNDPRVEPYWFQGPFHLSNATSGDDPWLWCWKEGAEWIREKEPNSIHENITGTDWFHKILTVFPEVYFPGQLSAMIGGVRAEEAPARTLGLTTAATWKDITWGQRKGEVSYTFSPIYDWTWRDVWKAIHQNGWNYNCNTGDALIWMGDFSFRRIDQVNPGDEVIGFTTDNGFTRKDTLVRTTVKAVGSHLAPVVKITLASGRTLRCTADHRWMTRRKNNAGSMWEYRPLEVGDAAAFVIEPEKPTPLTTTGAWLGGIYDGEGTRDQIIQSVDHNPDVCRAIERALSELDIPYTVGVRNPGVRVYRIKGDGSGKIGGRQAKVRFLDKTKPVRSEQLAGMILTSRFRNPDVVVAIEPDGEDMVYAMETGTHNYVARGYASSNSLYDSLWQYGVSPARMRVSNVHHQTSLPSLGYMREVEPETWDKVVGRLQGINTYHHQSDAYRCPHQLPKMFGGWKEYRDHLLKHLIKDDEIRGRMQKQFAGMDARYTDEIQDDLTRVEIDAILVNDWYGTLLGIWSSGVGRGYEKRKGTKRDRFSFNPKTGLTRPQEEALAVKGRKG